MAKGIGSEMPDRGVPDRQIPREAAPKLATRKRATRKLGIAKFGASGWDYDDWRGPLYPETPPRGFRALPLLARFTQFMEVNVSYYRILPSSATARWVEETPAEFTFIFKAWRGWTHDSPSGTTIGKSDAEVRAFLDLVAPAAEAGRLDGILVQFPPQLSEVNEALTRLAALREALSPHRIFAEFRHRDLYRESAYRALEREQIAFVNVDLPGVRQLPPLTSINTGPVAYLRLHGRHRTGWAKKVSRNERYDHLYQEEEINELTGVIDELLGRCPQVLVGANNHFGAQAPAVLAQLRSRIEGVPCAVPRALRTAFPAVREVTTDLPPDPNFPDSPEEMSLDLGPPSRT